MPATPDAGVPSQPQKIRWVFFRPMGWRRGTASGTELAGDNELQTSIWSDNDVTLWPGESETLTASYRAVDLNGSSPVISVSGWNVPKLDIPVS